MEANTATQNGEPAKAAPIPGTTKTQYVVLCASEDRKTFSVVAPVEANSADQAIRGVADRALKEGEESGVFVAVPARSWKLHKLTVEVERKVGLAEV